MIKYSEETKIKFAAMENLVFDDSGVAHKFYGIKVLDAHGSSLHKFEQLCQNEKLVNNFVSLCNDSEISFYHIEDVVEDFLVGLCI